jgi:hypothetical protein
MIVERIDPLSYIARRFIIKLFRYNTPQYVYLSKSHFLKPLHSNQKFIIKYLCKYIRTKKLIVLLGLQYHFLYMMVNTLYSSE